MVSTPVWLSWSSGKDSAWALQVLRHQVPFEVVALLTTINSSYGRVAMHAVREELLEQQADAVGLPLIKVPLPWPCSNADYEQMMAAALAQARREGIRHIAFGDLFLEDVRRYREAQLAGTGIEPLFPLWQFDTTQLARTMIACGLRAYLTCVDPRKLSPRLAGRSFDAALLDNLPPGVDPCGESGEFHTFAFEGPMFRHPVLVDTGEVVEREGFIFADLKPRGCA